MKAKGFFCILIISLVLIVGCGPKITEITAPPDSISLDEVTKFNLKQLDLDKLSKSDIKELDGVKLGPNSLGYELEYRYPDQPIKIKIIKFNSNEDISSFWRQWLAVHNLQIPSSEAAVKFQLENKYSVYAWQKGQWLTYIGVPNEPLRDKVKDIIANHYLNLAKKETTN
ncbi:MAG: hypothetical protein ACOYVD_05490 [Bacillota bacterium]